MDLLKDFDSKRKDQEKYFNEKEELQFIEREIRYVKGYRNSNKIGILGEMLSKIIC